MSTTIVYGIQNIVNLKMYIGVTTGSLSCRWRRHVATALSGKYPYKFYNAICKYGEGAFHPMVMSEHRSSDEAFEHEILLIQILNTRGDGYNTAAGGRGGPMRKNWTVDGVLYESKTAAANAHGISAPKMEKRLALGHTPEQAVGLEPLPTWKVGIIEVEGRRFASRAEASRFYGVDDENVRQRINVLGWSLEQALGLEPQPKRVSWNCDYIDVDGVQMSRAQAARSIGYNDAAVSVTMRRKNVTAQEAFEILKERKKNVP